MRNMQSAVKTKKKTEFIWNVFDYLSWGKCYSCL